MYFERVSSSCFIKSNDKQYNGQNKKDKIENSYVQARII